MGLFSKPKAPDYSKIEAEAKAKEKAAAEKRAAEQDAQQRAAMTQAESRRRAFTGSVAEAEDPMASRKRFLKPV